MSRAVIIYRRDAKAHVYHARGSPTRRMYIGASASALARMDDA